MGAGWGARSAAQDLEAGTFGVMPAPGPATTVAAALPPSAAAASGGSLEMARSGGGTARSGGGVANGNSSPPALREISGSGRLRDAIAAAAAEKMGRP